MKRLIPFVVFCSFILFSCSKDSGNPVNPQTTFNKVKIYNVTSLAKQLTYEITFNSQTFTFLPENYCFYGKEYIAFPNLINFLNVFFNFFYDKVGLPSQTDTYSNNVISSSDIYSYNSEGNLIGLIRKSELPEVYNFSFDYNQLKKPIKIEISSSITGLIMKYDFQYGTNGFITNEKVYESGLFSEEHIYTHDSSNYLFSEVVIDHLYPEPDTGLVRTYSYNNSGQIAKETDIQNGNIQSIDYVYSANGRIESQTKQTFFNGRIKLLFKYNSQGFWIEQSSYDEFNNLIQKYILEYE